MHPRIGTKRWDGTPIYVGYAGRMGNKEFEVDNEISKSEMPTITGSADDYDDDIELLGTQAEAAPFIEAKRSKSEVIDVDAPPRPSFRPPAPTPKPETPSSASKTYVSPASFYAPAQVKLKPKGPLWVQMSRLVFMTLIGVFLDTIRKPTVP